MSTFVLDTRIKSVSCDTSRRVRSQRDETSARAMKRVIRTPPLPPLRAAGLNSMHRARTGSCVVGCTCTVSIQPRGSLDLSCSLAAATGRSFASAAPRGGMAHLPSCGCHACSTGRPISARELAVAATPDPTNRGVVYMGPGEVEVRPIAFPKLELDSTSSPVPSERQKRKCEHGAILKVVTTNICGSDQHMVRGRTSLPGGYMVLGHEITGEVVEIGRDVEYIRNGDLCSVPFNIACGRCPACKRGDTGVCLNVNPARAGAAYGYVDMGGWVGGQAEYVMPAHRNSFAPAPLPPRIFDPAYHPIVASLIPAFPSVIPDVPLPPASRPFPVAVRLSLASRFPLIA
eukprot:6177073-Pleurochrysis_carterae.AAC.2